MSATSTTSAAISATDALRLVKYAVGQPVTLECQADGGPIAWDGGGDGFSWTDGLNWSLDRIPNACDAATIETGATVTHASGANAVRSVAADSPLDLTGGTLTLRDTVAVAGLFRLQGGTLANAQVQVPATSAPLVLTTTGGTLDKVVMNADMDVSTSYSYVNIANGLTLNGTATIGTNSGIYFNGSGEQALDGSGEVVFTSGGGQLYNYGNTVLHLGAGLLIHGGYGGIGGQQSTSQMLNDGTIDCDLATAYMDVGSYDVWTNAGIVAASNGCTTRLRGPWGSTGTLELDSTSTLSLGGAFSSDQIGTISRSGGTINLTGVMTNPATFTLDAQTGSWNMVGGTLKGGTLESADGARLIYTTSGGTLDGVAMNADMDLTTSYSYVNIANGLTLNGVATIGTNSGIYFNGAGEQALDGSGEVVFTSGGGQLYNYGNTVLHLGADLLVHGGYGGVGGQQGTSQMLNDGTIDCDLATAYMDVGLYDVWTNTGTVAASNGCTTRLRGPWSNAGTLGLDSTSTLNLGGAFSSDQVGTISRSGGTINLTGVMDQPRYVYAERHHRQLESAGRNDQGRHPCRQRRIEAHLHDQWRHAGQRGDERRHGPDHQLLVREYRQRCNIEWGRDDRDQFRHLLQRRGRAGPRR